MKTLSLTLIASLIAVGCSSSESSNVADGDSPTVVQGQEADEEADEDELTPLAEVPQAAIDAALAAVPGLVLKEAEREGKGVFCLHGYADGVFTEVEVDSDGNVIEIEPGDEDDDGGAAEDDDDDDDDDD
jgi:hypothetical protein